MQLTVPVWRGRKPKLGAVRPAAKPSRRLNLSSVEATDMALGPQEILAAMSAGRVAAWEFRFEPPTVRANDELARIMGTPFGRVPTQAELEACYMPGEADRVRELFQKSLARGSGTVSDCFRIGAHDDQERWVFLRFGPMFGADGRVIGVQGTTTDVTAEIRGRIVADQTEAKLRRIAELMPSIAWISSVIGELIYVNDAWTEFSGQSREEAVAGGWRHVFDRADFASLIEKGRDALAEGRPLFGAARMIRKDGVARWHRIHAEPFRDESGDVICWFGVNTDVHEQYVQERNVRTERDRFWELTSDLLVVAQAVGGILESTNPAWGRVLGWSDDDLMGRPFASFMHPEDADAIRARLAPLPVNATFDEECRMRTKDGVYRIIRWTTDVRDGLLYCVGRDITANREAELASRRKQEDLIQSRKLEAIGQVTGGIAHDFNNLLTAISGALSIAQIRLQGDQFEDVGKFVDMALNSARKAAGLTKSLLTFARRQSLEVRSEDVNGLIASMSDMLAGTVGETVKAEFDLAPDLWQAQVDPNQFSSAILNLTINARDAMPRGGRIRYTTRNVSVGRSDDLAAGDYVRVDVADTGTGMSQELIDRAFEPFFTTKPEGEGTGLGLPTVYGFFRQIGGQVVIESKVDGGTTIALFAPRAISAPSEDPSRDDDAGVDGHGQVVLVVEDNALVRDLTAEILRGAGYQLFEASNADDALELLESVRVDLLLADIGLPGMDGRELAEAARQKQPELKVLYVTGKQAPPDGGGEDILIKPFSVRELPERVKAALEA